MLRRLLLILVPTAFVLVAAVLVPLGTVVAGQLTQEMYVDRLGDAGRFTALARTALDTGRVDPLAREMERYEELYGIPAVVVAPDGAVVTGSGDRARMRELLDAAQARPIVTAAMAGERPAPPATVWPWSGEPLVVAEPIGRDSEVAGAVVVVSPTDRLGAEILGSWALLALFSVLPLTLLVSAVVPLSRWVLRPINRLDAATTAVSSGDLEVHVDAAGGPPELRRLTDSFNTMVGVVSRALDRQRAFVSEASHQLRNPLASLRLAVENLAPYLESEEAREAHAVAIDETTVMHRMLNSLLAATRLESLTGTEPVEAAEVLRSREERWRALGEGRGIAVETDVPAGLWVLAPAGGLGSILDELVSNALRLSGGTRVVVRADPGDPVRLRVLDDGEGLPEAEYALALDRFWRSPRHQNTEGTGLGLAIVADLMGEAGGRLVLGTGLPGTGRRGFGVTLELPAADPAPDRRDAD
ncbi:ATP-binding protein [Nocardiopsis changdeensis]|uniref:Signal transduction histidine-protein kinase/phosphatase MprB n=1 Tax=Nocardiopsis changdeensis TaxID=2831969 RepID=A0ABX8BKE6_9ACTN|nr:MULTISPECIES: HAMP domain-containing sensor histidine kinase [Nocardiopsis]QUX22539.1 HAMP domain-containing histidine kinase [Nocardiopsis changdeensis]QYX38480.1 HAMP domain-containing histidine kinase [Nocardiopsis sp. MT53]